MVQFHIKNSRPKRPIPKVLNTGYPISLFTLQKFIIAKLCVSECGLEKYDMKISDFVEKKKNQNFFELFFEPKLRTFDKIFGGNQTHSTV